MPLVLHEGCFALDKRGPGGGDGFKVKACVCDQVQDLGHRVRGATIGFDDRRVVGSRLCDRGCHQCIAEELAEFDAVKDRGFTPHARQQAQSCCAVARSVRSGSALPPSGKPAEEAAARLPFTRLTSLRTAPRVSGMGMGSSYGHSEWLIDIDQHAFEELARAHRGELHVHCYLDARLGPGR